MGMKMKKIAKALTAPNTIDNGGGLSSILMPVKASALGVGVIAGGAGLIGGTSAMLQTRNSNKMGRITYSGGPARMTGSFTSGGVEAMMRASQGNYSVFSDMASDAVTNDGLAGKIENYGVTPQFVSALYNMGGR